MTNEKINSIYAMLLNVTVNGTGLGLLPWESIIITISITL